MEKSCPCSYYGAKENYNNIICVIIMQIPISGRKGVKGFTQEISIKLSHHEDPTHHEDDGLQNTREPLRFWKPSSNLIVLHLLLTAVVVMGPKKLLPI